MALTAEEEDISLVQPEQLFASLPRHLRPRIKRTRSTKSDTASSGSLFHAQNLAVLVLSLVVLCGILLIITLIIVQQVLRARAVPRKIPFFTLAPGGVVAYLNTWSNIKFAKHQQEDSINADEKNSEKAHGSTVITEPCKSLQLPTTDGSKWSGLAWNEDGQWLVAWTEKGNYALYQKKVKPGSMGDFFDLDLVELFGGPSKMEEALGSAVPAEPISDLILQSKRSVIEEKNDLQKRQTVVTKNPGKLPPVTLKRVLLSKYAAYLIGVLSDERTLVLIDTSSGESKIVYSKHGVFAATPDQYCVVESFPDFISNHKTGEKPCYTVSINLLNYDCARIKKQRPTYTPINPEPLSFYLRDFDQIMSMRICRTTNSNILLVESIEHTCYSFCEYSSLSLNIYGYKEKDKVEGAPIETKLIFSKHLNHSPQALMALSWTQLTIAHHKIIQTIEERVEAVKEEKKSSEPRDESKEVEIKPATVKSKFRISTINLGYLVISFEGGSHRIPPHLLIKYSANLEQKIRDTKETETINTDSNDWDFEAKSYRMPSLARQVAMDADGKMFAFPSLDNTAGFNFESTEKVIESDTKRDVS